VRPAESGSCYVSGTGMLCVMRRAVNVRSVEKDMYHSASAEADYVRIVHTRPNVMHPNSAITTLFHIKAHRRGVGDGERSVN
jgi:hypothetical protein